MSEAVTSIAPTHDINASDLLTAFVELYNQESEQTENIELQLAMQRSQAAADKREIDALKGELRKVEDNNSKLSGELRKVEAMVRDYNGLSQQMATMKIRHDNVLAENKELKGTDNPVRLRKQIANLKKRNAELSTANDTYKKRCNAERSDKESYKAKVLKQHHEMLSLSQQLTIASVSTLYQNNGEYLARLPKVRNTKVEGEVSKSERMMLAYTRGCDVWRSVMLDEYGEISFSIPASLEGKADSTKSSVVRHLPNPSPEVIDFARQWLIKVKRQNNALYSEDLIAFQGAHHEA